MRSLWVQCSWLLNNFIFYRLAEDEEVLEGQESSELSMMPS